MNSVLAKNDGKSGRFGKIHPTHLERPIFAWIILRTFDRHREDDGIKFRGYVQFEGGTLKERVECFNRKARSYIASFIPSYTYGQFNYDAGPSLVKRAYLLASHGVVPTLQVDLRKCSDSGRLSLSYGVTPKEVLSEKTV